MIDAALHELSSGHVLLSLHEQVSAVFGVGVCEMMFFMFVVQL